MSVDYASLFNNFFFLTNQFVYYVFFSLFFLFRVDFFLKLLLFCCRWTPSLDRWIFLYTIQPAVVWGGNGNIVLRWRSIHRNRITIVFQCTSLQRVYVHIASYWYHDWCSNVPPCFEGRCPFLSKKKYFRRSPCRFRQSIRHTINKLK